MSFRLEGVSGIQNTALAVGAVGLMGCVLFFVRNREQFFQYYLTSYIFWTTIGLGALFFIMLHHLVDATWSVVLRRLVESVMSNLPLMFVFFLPIAFLGLHDLYHWSHADAVAKDHLLQHKAPYLNQKGFVIRALIYFGIWCFIAKALYRWSLDHDKNPTQELLSKMRTLSGPGMLCFALTITFAAFDWLMSLDPHWYSTIFGVYVFVGSLLAILAFTTLIVVVLRANNVLTEEITIEHFHDLGKLIFAFTVFWTYIAFSQYFLIWYGNVPEETIWYRHRWEGGWNKVSLLIVFGHFVAPFLILLSRVPKRNVAAMTVMSLWMLFIHWVDLYWIILPSFHDMNHHFHIGLSDIAIIVTAFIGVGGVFLFFFWRRLASNPIVPINDPKLKASINFVNT